jgi:poly(3-hydroxyalkanoate) synthetase
MDWAPATEATKDEDIAGLVGSVVKALNYIGRPCHVIGLCQGGWLATIVAALHPDKVLSLTPIAAPIDAHAGGGVIHDTITRLGMFPAQMAVAMNNGIMSGAMMLLNWKLMHPFERFVQDFTDIWDERDNQKKLAKIHKFRTWYEYTQDIAGAWYLEVTENLFLKNQLINGRMVVGGQVVELEDITCPVFTIAGEKDDITLPEQVIALNDAVSSIDTTSLLIPDCGHVGCFMSIKSQPYIEQAVLWVRRGEAGRGDKPK